MIGASRPSGVSVDEKTYYKFVVQILGDRNLIPKSFAPAGLQNQVTSKCLARRGLEWSEFDGSIGWIA